jgi:DNA adenine methylase
MAPWIVKHLPPHDHYIEGCAGSAAVLAVKPPVDTETINDTYGEVVNFFRVLRDPAQSARLIDLVAFTPYAVAEFQHAGAMLEDPDELDPVDRAWAFLVRMQMAVVPGRSGWSYSLANGRKANKPGRWATMPHLLQAAAARFARVQVESRPVVDLIDRYDAPGALMFIDPPYTEDARPASTGASSAYVEDAFDHHELLDAVRSARHMRFAIVHYPDPLYDGAGFYVVGDFESHRNVPNGEGRADQVERLYLSHAPDRADTGRLWDGDW